MDEFTEADEPLQHGTRREQRERALLNLRHQLLRKETMGVIAMYERAALRVGVTWTQINYLTWCYG